MFWSSLPPIPSPLILPSPPETFFLIFTWFNRRKQNTDSVLCCLYMHRCRAIYWVIYNFEENWLSLPHQTSVANNSSAMSGSLWPPPLSMLKFFLAWHITGLVHTFIDAVNSCLQLPCRIGKYHFTVVSHYFRILRSFHPYLHDACQALRRKDAIEIPL